MFMLLDNPAHPGEYFPRTSGLKIRYDLSRPKFDVVTSLEIGDINRGYKAIDITGQDTQLYSVTTPLYLGTIIVAIPKFTKGMISLVAKNKNGQPLKSQVEAVIDLRGETPDLLPPGGFVDKEGVATTVTNGTVREIKEWQAIMDYLRKLPTQNGELPMVPVDEKANEVRAIKV
jgi:5'-nucleotidase